MNVVIKKVALHVILPLLIGLIIYLIARPDTWLVQKLMPLGFHLIEKNRDILSTGWPTKFLVFSGPDFCWSYSFISALFIWESWQESRIKFFPFYVLLFLLGAELIQIFFTSYFTMDWLDIFATIIAFCLSYYINWK